MNNSVLISMEALIAHADDFFAGCESESSGCGYDFFMALGRFMDSVDIKEGELEKVDALHDKLKAVFKEYEFLLFLINVRVRTAKKEVCPNVAYDQWVADLYQWFNGLSDERKAIWNNVLEMANVSASKPSPAWKKTAKVLVENDDLLVRELELVLNLVTNPKRTSCSYYAWDEGFEYVAKRTGYIFHSRNIDTIKGLVWLGGLIESERMASVISSVGVSCIKKISGYGARSKKITNATVLTLSEMNIGSALGYINRIYDACEYSQTSSFIKRKTKEIRDNLSASGFDEDDIHEISVPTMELNSDFEVREWFDDVEGIIKIEDSKQVTLVWKSGLKTHKAVPAEIKSSYVDEIKSFKKLQKAIESSLSGWRARIESYFLKDREWSFQQWKERFIDNPLLGAIARDLIWVCSQENQQISCMWRGEGLVGSDGVKVAVKNELARVKLWHPVQATISESEAWQTFIFDSEVLQPFKQAFREVYVITDAERQTKEYSNRFAAHIIFQPKFAALAKQRGWSFDMIGDGGEYRMHNNAVKSTSPVRATFSVQEVAKEHQTASGYYEYLATDQVFFSVDGNRICIEDVPEIVFSELMRDVDLFVGVCSVATDPEWKESGIEGYLGTWDSTAFGELTSTADTRKAALRYILPKLNISKKCELIERFLIVNGDQRQYKIHLGSGNILMSPNDQYLCIVPTHFSASMRKVNKLFLPFQEDYMLSIILSKAFLLANDSKIKDDTILSQFQS
ncbi:DUF4132 domain-containing protein [Saccharophagus degradans]|uniref:DUF4132 domain-containing protein n=1 Tax=Saccharophagus degradans TaxID=86304 RepID=UPI003A807384